MGDPLPSGSAVSETFEHRAARLSETRQPVNPFVALAAKNAAASKALDATPVPFLSSSTPERKQFGNARVLALSPICLQFSCSDQLEYVDFPDRLSVAGRAGAQDYLAVTIPDGRKGYIERKYVELDVGCKLGTGTGSHIICP